MRLALVLLILLVAGCTKSPAPATTPALPSTPMGPAPPPVPTVPSAAVRHIHQEFPLAPQDVEVAGSHSESGRNCVVVDTPMAHVDGNATVRWTPGPADPSMELVVTDGGQVLGRAEGTGVVTVALRNASLGDGPQGTVLAWQIGPSNRAGATATMHGVLTLDLAYLADSDVKPNANASCGVSG